MAGGAGMEKVGGGGVVRVTWPVGGVLDKVGGDGGSATEGGGVGVAGVLGAGDEDMSAVGKSGGACLVDLVVLVRAAGIGGDIWLTGDGDRLVWGGAAVWSALKGTNFLRNFLFRWVTCLEPSTVTR